MANIFNTQSLENPCKINIEYTGAGEFVYWDKEQEKQVSFGKEVSFIPIYIHSVFAGFDMGQNKRIYSTEWENQNQDIKVFCNGKVIASGKFADIKDDVYKVGGKFAKAVYAAMFHKKETYLVKFTFSGKSVFNWMEFYKNSTLPKLKLVTLSTSGKEKHGRTIYHVFSGKLTRDTGAKLQELAVEKAKEMKAYFEQYFAADEELETLKGLKEQEQLEAPAQPLQIEASQAAEETQESFQADDLPF